MCPACDIACSADLFGLNPLLLSWNLASQIGSSTCKIHCCTTLSHIAGIPSGLVFPSDSDIISTRELSEALNTVKIGFWDHVIVGGNQYYSFRESRNY